MCQSAMKRRRRCSLIVPEYGFAARIGAARAPHHDLIVARSPHDHGGIRGTREKVSHDADAPGRGAVVATTRRSPDDILRLAIAPANVAAREARAFHAPAAPGPCLCDDTPVDQ